MSIATRIASLGGTRGLATALALLVSAPVLAQTAPAQRPAAQPARPAAPAQQPAQGAQPQKVVRFVMPLGLLLQPGLRFAVDQGQATPGRYVMCLPNGCFAEAQVKDDFIAAIKKGANLNVSVQNQMGREITFAVPAAGFGKAFDGPPIDPKVLEEQQKKLQEELQKRSEELRKQLGSNSGGAAPAAGRAGGGGSATPPAP